jgi:NHLM bacteriocin system ABC transporter ATP-binding protein
MADAAAFPATSATPILLNGRDEVWQVEQGAVDIFAVALAAGAPAGAREHLCRLAPGQALMGLGVASSAVDTGLLAVCLPGSRLLQVAVSVAGVDGWLIALSTCMAVPPPRTCVDALPGGPIEVQAGDDLYARDAVVWLEAAPLALAWMPADQPLASANFFPLAPTTWAHVREQGTVTCHSTATALESGRLEAGLAAFHLATLDDLRRRRDEREAMVQDRQALRQRSDEQMFGSALASLTKVLAVDGDISAGRAVRYGDAFANAAQLVMDASSIALDLKAGASDASAVGRIEDLAHQACCSYRSVSLSAESWWREDAGPLLAFRRADDAPVALLPAGGQGYWMVEPDKGIRERLDRQSAAALGDTAFMFFRSFPDQVIGMLDLLRFGLAGTRRDLLRIVCVGALGGLLGLFTPFATGLLIDSVIPSAQAGELVQLVLLLLTAALGISAFELSRAIAMLRVDARVGNAAQAAIMHRLLHLPAAFFRRYSAGDLADRAFSIARILDLLSNTAQAALLSWVFGLFSFAYLFFIDWRLALLAACLVMVALVFTTVLNFFRLGLEREMFQVQGDIASRVLQILNGIGKIRSNGAEKRAFALWARDFSRQKTIDFKTQRIGNVLSVFNAGYVVLTSLALFAAVALFMPDISTGSFLAFNAAFAQFFAATLAATSALTASLNAIPLYERARPILQALPEVAASRSAPGQLTGAIDISHVTFRYAPDGPPILDDMSIRIEAGEFVALVGPSGSGKSTLLRLLLGFEHPESGAVYYDGQDMSGLDAGAVRRQLGVVLQSGKLMPGDIFTNIVGSAPLTLEDAWEAARMAGFEEDIKSMPMGMHTVIAEGAGTISGGQKQRLMVARAIVKKPRILLFDEATSALDNQTQAIVAQSVARLNATRVVIAHRLSTIVKADRIFVIEAGRVVESGSYHELMARNQRFAELAKRQLA